MPGFDGQRPKMLVTDEINDFVQLDTGTVVDRKVFEDAVRRAGLLPLTNGQGGPQIGTATAKMTDDGLEIEGVVEGKYAHLVPQTGTYSIPGHASNHESGPAMDRNASVDEEMPDGFFEQEVKELGELIDELDRVKDMEPYKPNRAQRRAQAKRDRALQKRNPRG